jgi:hypothetical protein
MTTKPWSGPTDVDEATLRLGDELGSGGQGRVLRVTDHPGLVFKQYKMVGADPAALKLLVDLPAQLPPADHDSLYAQTSWPLARVFSKGKLSGFLMQEIPGRFFGTNSAGSKKLRELQYLVYPRKPLWGDIVPDAGVPADTRVEVAREFTKLIGTLHGRGLVIGDMSMSNLLWTGTGGAAVTIFVIDCDGIRRLGSGPVLPQADTLDWNDPLQPASGPDLDTDRYKLALLIGRVLAMSPYIRPGDQLSLLPGIPDQVATRLAAHWQQAAGKYGTRPPASQWLMALSNRNDIPVQPWGKVRPRDPGLPERELEDPTASRPVIKLPPYGTGPMPRQTGT